jgi:hypothetical protein
MGIVSCDGTIRGLGRVVGDEAVSSPRQRCQPERLRLELTGSGPQGLGPGAMGSIGLEAVPAGEARQNAGAASQLVLTAHGAVLSAHGSSDHGSAAQTGPAPGVPAVAEASPASERSAAGLVGVDGLVCLSSTGSSSTVVTPSVGDPALSALARIAAAAPSARRAIRITRREERRRDRVGLLPVGAGLVGGRPAAGRVGLVRSPVLSRSKVRVMGHLLSSQPLHIICNAIMLTVKAASLTLWV